MPDPAQIHLVTHEYPPFKGGAATFCREMALAAATQGHPVHVWGPRYMRSHHQHAAATTRPDPGRSGAPPGGPLPALAPSDTANLTCHALSLRGQLDLLDQLGLRHALRTQVRRQFRPGDLLHLAEPGPVAVAARFPSAVAFADKNLMVTLHGSEILHHTRNPAASRRFQRLLRMVRTVHLLSQHNADLLRSRIPDLNTPLTVIPGGPRQFPRTTPALADFLPPAAEFELIQVARLHPRKGQHLLIQALADLPAAIRTKIRLWCVGPLRDHGYYRNCYRFARRGKVACHFLHGCPDSLLPVLYRRAQVAVMSSVESKYSIEGFGLANLEASSFGLPIVAFDCGGIRETIQSGVTGLLIAPGDVTSLGQSIQRLISDPLYRKTLSRNATEYAASFSWSRAASALYGERTPSI